MDEDTDAPNFSKKKDFSDGRNYDRTFIGYFFCSKIPQQDTDKMNRI